MDLDPFCLFIIILVENNFTSYFWISITKEGFLDHFWASTLIHSRSQLVGSHL
jgi:hypothetical protein